MKHILLKTISPKLAAGVVAGILVASCSGGSSDVPDDGFTVGETRVTPIEPAKRKAPLTLAGTTLDGEQLDLASLRGRVVVLNIWYASCGPCRAEAPALVDLATTSKSKGVEFVGVHTRDDNLAAARTFVEDFAIPYDSIDDPDGKMIVALRKKAAYRAPPTTFVLDKQGRVAGRIAGEVKTLQLRALIDEVVGE